jgi:excisionase family DNA binding protein
MNEIVCEMLRLSEAAKRLSVSPNKLRAMADRGEVPCKRFGNERRFPVSALVRWIESQEDWVPRNEVANG